MKITTKHHIELDEKEAELLRLFLQSPKQYKDLHEIKKLRAKLINGITNRR